MFELNDTIERNANTEEKDTANVKMALTSLGYYDDTETGLSPYADDSFFHSVKDFQKDNDLKVDGIVKPKGPTEEKIKEKLTKDKKAGNAFGDFKRNRDNMIEARTKGADKYFHCVANYEAAERGWLGDIAASTLSTVREVSQSPKIFKDGFIETTSNAIKDHKANRHGRNKARSKQYRSAKEACAIFRPKGLNEKY